MTSPGDLPTKKKPSSYPLAWPANRKKCPPHERPPTLEKRETGPIRYAILRALQGMGATDVVLSTNIPLTGAGVPERSDTGLGECPGAALYFTLKGQKIVLTCDMRRRVADNLYALQRALDAIHVMGQQLDAKQVGLVLEALRAPEDL